MLLSPWKPDGFRFQSKYETQGSGEETSLLLNSNKEKEKKQKSKIDDLGRVVVN